jgi:hypothetical protein
MEENESSMVAGEGFNQVLRSQAMATDATKIDTPIQSAPLTVKSSVQLIVEIEG